MREALAFLRRAVATPAEARARSSRDDEETLWTPANEARAHVLLGALAGFRLADCPRTLQDDVRALEEGKSPFTGGALNDAERYALVVTAGEKEVLEFLQAIAAGVRVVCCVPTGCRRGVVAAAAGRVVKAGEPGDVRRYLEGVRRELECA